MKWIFCALFSALVASTVHSQIAPSKSGTLSSTHLLSVERLSPDDSTNNPQKAPDGLLYCFLVARNPPATHKFAIKETKDFQVGGASYLASTRTKLGASYTPITTVHGVAKFAAQHSTAAVSLAKAPPDSLVITVAIGGAPLKDGEPAELTLHVGFGRTPDEFKVEALSFRTQVPAK
jgi:hypothetical protein